ASSSTNSPTAAFSSCTSSALIALAGGRCNVMIANVSSRSTSSVSYAIQGDSSQEHGGDRVRGVAQPVFSLSEHPRRSDLIHGAEERLRRHLDGHVAANHPGGLTILEDRRDQREVRGDLV